MFSFFLTAALLTASPLTTEAERSGWRRTGRYDEVLSLCRAFPRTFPGKVRCDVFGETPEGRKMVAFIAGRPTARRPLVYLQGGIHAGEIDGKDAGFWLLKDLLSGKAAPGLLDQVTLLFVPVINPDGHERFGPNHRANQVGPEEMGFRVTAQNLNLNRDHAKAEAPEMQALLALLNKHDPILYADLHVTDGAKFQPDISLLIEPKRHGSQRLRPLAKGIEDRVFPALKALGHQPLNFYPSFETEDDPASGFGSSVAPPRFSQGYWPLRNRFGVLVETHSWKDYGTRVRATYDACLALLQTVAGQGKELLEAARRADLDDERGAVAEVVLSWEQKKQPVQIDFPGYAYTRTPSKISGGIVVRYDDTKPQIWKVPFFEDVEPLLTAKKPGAGYLIPPGHSAVVRKLALHGFRAIRLANARTEEVEVFRATRADFQSRPYEGRQVATVKGSWSLERRDLPAGTFFVPVAQPGAQLLVHLLEPTARDSFLSWGFFNAHFEQKEYMEAYVAEAAAAEMLAGNTALAAEFDKRLKDDPLFAKDSEARLEFFYRRHPAWDERVNLYPVFRTNRVP